MGSYVRPITFSCLALSSGCPEVEVPTSQPPVAESDSPAVERENDWDPSVAIDPMTLSTKHVFVLSEHSAVCPTRDEARARACGNSVEDPGLGVRIEKGAAVEVVGAEPVGGFWRALRYQKAGVLPGWVLAADLAAHPDTSALDELDSLEALKKARDATEMTRDGLLAVPKNALVAWPRSRGVRYGSFSGRVLVFVDLSAGGAAAIDLPPPSSDDAGYIEHHSCLVYGDCLALSYICDDGYCDEVSIVAQATGETVDAPEDPEGEWPHGAGPFPVFEAVHLADRFGRLSAVAH